MWNKIAIVVVSVVLVLTLAIVGCAKPAPPAPAPTVPTPAVPTPAPPTPPAPTEELPEMIGIASYAMGSTAYVIYAALADGIYRRTGMNVRVVPFQTNKARLTSILKGETVVSTGVYRGCYSSIAGIWEWAEEGPQAFRIIWNSEPVYSTLVCRGDSGIKTGEDLRGKRFGTEMKFDPAMGKVEEAMLAFLGLTFDDVVLSDVPTYTVAFKQIMEGKIDCAAGSPAGTVAYEMLSSIHGLYSFEFPPENVEGWKKMKETFPMMSPVVVTVGGAGASPDNPKDWGGTPYTQFCRTDADEYLIYRIVKAWIESYDDYKDAHPKAVLWSIKEALNLDYLKCCQVPYHPGAVRAFKEAGLWTAEHEALHQKKLAFDEGRFKLWSETLDKGAAEGILVGTKAWAELWETTWGKYLVEETADW